MPRNWARAAGACLLLLAGGCQSSGTPDASAAREPAPEDALGEGEVAWLAPEDLEVVRRLQSAEPEEQRAALTELSVSPDGRMVPYILACLDSPDAIVRHQAATVLSDLGAGEAVVHLIGLLGDAEPFVRNGAYIALRKITRQPIEFLPYGTEEERRTAQAAWREWWASGGGRTVGEVGQR